VVEKTGISEIGKIAQALRACLRIRFERDSCFASDVIHTLDVDTQAAEPDGQDRRKDQALSL
jgi:hypothetical protein